MKINLLIATPAYGSHCHTDYLHSMLSLVRGAERSGVGVEVMTIGNESLITRGRNTLISYFYLNKEFTHVIFVDADVGLETQTIPNMLKANVDVIGCPVPLKGVDEKGLPVLNVGNVVSANKQGLAIVDRIGTAVLMLSRKAVDALIEVSEPYGTNSKYSRGHGKDEINWDVFSAGVVDGEYLSEDYYVCKRLRDLGFEIYADMTAIIKHSGTFEFSATREQIEKVIKWPILSST